MARLVYITQPYLQGKLLKKFIFQKLSKRFCISRKHICKHGWLAREHLVNICSGLSRVRSVVDCA